MLCAGEGFSFQMRGWNTSFSPYFSIFGVLGKCDVLSGPDFAAEAKSCLPLTSVRGCHNTALDLTFFIHYWSWEIVSRRGMWFIYQPGLQWNVICAGVLFLALCSGKCDEAGEVGQLWCWGLALKIPKSAGKGLHPPAMPHSCCARNFLWKSPLPLLLWWQQGEPGAPQTLPYPIPPASPPLRSSWEVF